MVKQSIDHSSGDIRHLNQSQREEIKQSDNTVNEHHGVLSDKPGQSQGPKKHVKKKKGTNDLEDQLIFSISTIKTLEKR